MEGTDLKSDIDTGFQNLAEALDYDMDFHSGLLSALPSAGIAGRFYLATDDTTSNAVEGSLYWDDGSAWRGPINQAYSSGVTEIATEETTTSSTYTTLTTPDQVSNIVVPTDGLLYIGYRALVKQSSSAPPNGRVAIFIDSTQLQIRQANSASLTNQEAIISTTHYAPLTSTFYGLDISAAADSTDTHAASTSANILAAYNGSNYVGGIAVVEVPAGTYDISVRFNMPGGSPTLYAKDRKLWVLAEPF